VLLAAGKYARRIALIAAFRGMKKQALIVKTVPGNHKR